MASDSCSRRNAVRTTTSTKRRRTDRATSVWSSIRRKTSWSRTGRSMVDRVAVFGASPRTLWLYDVASGSHVEIRSDDDRRARCRRSSRRTRSSSRTRWTLRRAGPGRSWSRCRSRARSGRSRRAAGPSPIGEADGRELVYMSVDGWLMSVAHLWPTRAFTPSAPQRLFQMTNPGAARARPTRRFRATASISSSTAWSSRTNVPSIHVVVNWQTLMNREGSGRRRGYWLSLQRQVRAQAAERRVRRARSSRRTARRDRGRWPGRGRSRARLRRRARRAAAPLRASTDPGRGHRRRP